jgi:signal transduction histidine kinase
MIPERMLKSRPSLIALTLPEYRGRHIFTARLRIAVFIGFWALYLYFFRDVLEQTWAITLIISGSFILTAIAYYNVIKDRWLVLSFILELIADLVAITVVLYLSGGPYSYYYTLYIFYCFAAGVFYNYLLAALLALCSTLFYGAFLLLCQWAIIPPLILDYGDRPPLHAHTPPVLFVLFIIFVVLAVYGVKIVSFFSQRRERALEWRNKQLMALHQMSATIRSTESLRSVIQRILVNVLTGLGFETVLLMLIDRGGQCVRLYAPGVHPLLDRIRAEIGRPVDGMTFPIKVLDSPALQSIMKHEIIFRHDIVEATEGLREVISEETGRKLQDLLRIHKVVGIPLVAEEDVLGALVGFAKSDFVGEETVEAFEAFANQAALNLEAARLIDELKKTNERLREANRVKSEFLAIMSHELRTPLTAIIGFSELLIEGVMGELTSDQRDSVREVLNNGADLLEMINSLLDLSKIESGKMKVDRRRFDLKETIERVQRTVSSLLQRKEHNLIVDMPAGVKPVEGDERKIQQVILNLLSNAIKFTPEGGEIKVRVRDFRERSAMEADEEIRPYIEDKPEAFPNGAMMVQVEDTGIGIEPKHLEVIFDMFQQVDSSITRSFGGTGLGLALAKQMIELHAGMIWAESEPGKGATFSILLPY